MEKIIFNSDVNYYYANIYQVDSYVVRLVFEYGTQPSDIVLLSGFKILNSNGSVQGDFSIYTTMYKKESNTSFVVSGNGSVYVDPDPEEQRIILINQYNGEISCLKQQLLDSDFYIIKAQEAILVGDTPPYTTEELKEISDKRKVIRLNINELQQKIADLG